MFAALQNTRSLGAADGAQLTDSMASIFDRAGDTCRAATSRVYLAGHLDNLGMADSSMAVLVRCRGIIGVQCGIHALTALYNNLTQVLLSLGRFEEADSLAREAFVLLPAEADVGMVRFNQGIALASMGRFSEAMESFHAMYVLGRAKSHPRYVELGLLNMGTVHAIEGRLDAADTCFRAALTSAAISGNREHQFNALRNLAGIAHDQGHGPEALALLDSAARMAHKDRDLDQLSGIMLSRTEVLIRYGDKDSAFTSLRRFLVLRDSLLNEKRVLAVAEVEEKYESEKKAREIEHLKVANLDSEVQRLQALRTRNIYLGAGLGVLLLAAGLWNRLRFVRRSRAIIQKEKEISEGLLHNILPEEVADELKAKGYADVKEFEHATILFSDFKGFTQIAAQLPPADLVAEIDACFKAFDMIMERHRIEKIKTIGDAYMAAGGLPDPVHGPPAEVLRAALEMQEFIDARHAERDARNLPAFRMRVGIHSGPVVAGIVGVKKFAYDIWGDTVNTASRMESSGEVGEVNISEATYALVKDDPGLMFTMRGKVEAKGKGGMEMYFVHRSPERA